MITRSSAVAERPRVSVSFLQKYPPGSVLRRPKAAENRGYDQGDDGRRGVLDARRRPSRLCFSQFATRMVDNAVDLYAAKPDIRPESRFLPTPPAFDAPVKGVQRFRRNSATPFGMEKLEWCGYPMVKTIRRFFILFDATHERDRHTHGQTDIQTPYDDIGRAYA